MNEGDELEKTYLEALAIANTDRHAMAKSMAYFLFREVVEDIHSKYNIPDEEMMALNKKAYNRAAFLTDYVLNNPDMRKAFTINAIYCTEWDDPEMTGDLVKCKDVYSEIAGDLLVERLKTKKNKKTMNNGFSSNNKQT